MSKVVKYRLFNSLVEIIKGRSKEIVEKIMLYKEDGSTEVEVVHIDDNGYKYYVPNNSNDEDGLFMYDNIHDAFKAIINDDADTIYISELLGMKLTEVRRYIDRDYGEKVRYNYIKQFSGINFTFSIKCNNRYYSHFNTKNEAEFARRLMSLAIAKDILTYDSLGKDERSEFIRDFQCNDRYNVFVSVMMSNERKKLGTSRDAISELLKSKIIVADSFDTTGMLTSKPESEIVRFCEEFLPVEPSIDDVKEICDLYYGKYKNIEPAIMESSYFKNMTKDKDLKELWEEL